jgi:hypothetical protein
MQEEPGLSYESFYVGEDRVGLQSRASTLTRVSDPSHLESFPTTKSNDINSLNKASKLTAEQLEIIRLQSENFDLRRICEQLQHKLPNLVSEQVAIVYFNSQVIVLYKLKSFFRCQDLKSLSIK